MNPERFLELLKKLGTITMLIGIIGVVISVLLCFFNQVIGSVFVWGLLAVVGWLLKTQLPQSSGV